MLAPIVIFAFHRPQHTKRLLDSLAVNPESRQTEIIVFVDGLKTDASEQVKNHRNEVLEILEGEKRFKKLKIINQEINKGLASSIVAGVTQVVNENGKVIVLEDDLIVSPSFINYMNTALLHYENHKEVGQIGACNFFANGDDFPKSFFTVIPDCLGWATWKDRWDAFEADGEKLLATLNRFPAAKNRFTAYQSYPFMEMLENQIAGKISSWAIRWQATCAIHNWLTLYPNYSMTQHFASIEATHAAINILPPLCTEDYKLEKVEIIELPEVKAALINGYSGISDYFGQIKPVSLISKVAHKIRWIKPRLKRKVLSIFNPKPIAGWSGDYLDWNEAEHDCTGYNSENILMACSIAAKAVEQMGVACERDSILFDQLEYSEELLRIFQQIIEKEGELRVMDFGGSLGSTFRVFRQLLGSQISHWGIVEQPHFVLEGQSQFSNQQLQFFETPEKCKLAIQPNVILLSSVLQYLKSPVNTIQELKQLEIPYIVLDRTSVIQQTQTILTKQVVPNYIYDGSYPCWFFSEEYLMAMFSNSYQQTKKFDSYCEKPILLNGKIQSYWKGFLLERIQI